ncbi:hypothetical protein ABZT06_39175 [Streptomyces sp. NPDC005483]|uniref:DUF6919 domain-containing protein n=1 Tax=Streptomyces sp. NPDC005483 TaxID=3154882 RepID=UPI0033B93B43
MQSTLTPDACPRPRVMSARWRQERADRRAWRRAESWPELCELMADYVESLDPELPQDEVLARTNRAGYLIHTAMPGGIEQDGDSHRERRAAVFGFVFDMDLYGALARVADVHGLTLLVRSVRDGDELGGQAVERIDGVDGTEIGASKSVATLHGEWGHLGPVGRGLLYAVRQVTLIDPMWGSNDRLWKALGEAIDLYETQPVGVHAF